MSKQTDKRSKEVVVIGASMAGLLAAAILATTDPGLAERLKAFREAQTAAVAERPS